MSSNEKSYEYDGPVSEMKGGGQNTTVTQADPWEGVQPYLLEGFENLDQAAQNIPSYFPGQTYAGFDPQADGRDDGDGELRPG